MRFVTVAQLEGMPDSVERERLAKDQYEYYLQLAKKYERFFQKSNGQSSKRQSK